MTAMTWLYPTTPGDYEGDVYLWVDPLQVMDTLGLDPGNEDDVLLATELVAEASLILDVALDYQYGPSRCVSATYRIRAFPILDFAPPIQTIHAVVLHDDSCLPSDDVYVPQTGGLPWWQSWANALLSQGTVLEPGSTYCIDTPRSVRLCGGLAGQSFTGWYGYGYGVATGVYVGNGGGCMGCQPSNLVTVLYQSRANWPPGLSRIFMTLLKDLHASTNADGTCALPVGTTSVTRQGVSWSAEPGDDTGTGIPAVDSWVARHQKKVRLRDPMHATLLYSRYYDCSAFASYDAPCAIPMPVAVGAMTAPSARKPWSAPALTRR